jgi:SpoIID/LytB domain protein
MTTPRLRGSALGALIVVLAAGAPLALSATSGPAAASGVTSVVLVGHGYGHGIGMGQWGSLGYALGDDGGAGNFGYGQILSHYYGGTTLETLGTAPAPPSLHGGQVIVAMTQNNGSDLIATAASGTLGVAGVTNSAVAVLFRLTGPGSTYEVFTSQGCAGQGGGWQLIATGVNEPTAVAVNGGPVDLCQPGPSIEVHGSLTALANSAGQARTVNTVPLEEYVADVAPSESPSSWAELGGAGPQGQFWGFQQSEAQTVAARSYVEANPLGYGGYADTCDQTCQSYPGMANETPTSVLAARGTAGQVMVIDGTSTVATTEYSASSGGYSAGAQFPAVVDAGDGVCVSASVCDPNHDWTATLSGASIDAAYPSIGTFTSLDVTSRNGDGDEGGRVNEMTVTGTAGSVSVTGSQFAAALGLKSNWFALADPSGGDGPGYWLAASNGGLFSFGGAHFYGSAGNLVLNRPIVGMAATPDGGGYWLVASDGGIFTFGDARFYGSLGASPPASPVVGMAPAAGGGYWLLEAVGTVHGFGAAPAVAPGGGSPGVSSADSAVTAMAPSPDGKGYVVVDARGQAFSYGDVLYAGDVASVVPGYSGLIVGSAANPG